ncbi:MAG: cytochrome c3 family protein [Bacteroidota bacterium]
MAKKFLFSGISTALILFFTLNSLLAASANHPEKNQKLGYKEKKRAERLFYGLIRINNEDPVDCASCHNTGYIDTLNWNPSAYAIAKSSGDIDSAAFANLLLNPGGNKMQEAHAGINLPAEDIVLLQAFLREFKETGPIEKKPSIDKLIFFIGMILLIILSVVDLTITKKIRFRALHLVILIGATFFAVELVAKEAIALGRSEGYAPLQPVKFSHKVHAGMNQTDCLYCHNTAEFSKSAGIPSVNVCMNCHIVVREGANSGKFEINKIIAANDSGVPLEWVQVHRMPDHVFFSHAQHVGAGKLDCAECHGTVEEMDVLHQVNDMSMGWCLDCHRTQGVQFLDNEYYKTFEEFHKDIASGAIDSVTVEQIGGTECMKCHY